MKTNTKNIMKTAHSLTAAARREFPAADYSATFRAALRIAWKAEKGKLSKVRAAEVDALTAAANLDALRADFWARFADSAPVDAWNAICYQGALCLDILTRAVWKARERDMAGTDSKGNPRPPVMDWIVSNDDAQSVANEMYVCMGEDIARAAARDAENGTETHIATVFYRAARRAARRIHKAEHENPSILRDRQDENGRLLRDANGEKVQYFVGLDESPIAEKIAPAPDIDACLNDAIRAAAADDIDMGIIAARAYGLTQAETAAAMGLKQYQISRRIERINARYSAEHFAANDTPAAPAPVVAWTETKTPAARAAAAENARTEMTERLQAETAAFEDRAARYAETARRAAAARKGYRKNTPAARHIAKHAPARKRRAA